MQEKEEDGLADVQLVESRLLEARLDKQEEEQDASERLEATNDRREYQATLAAARKKQAEKIKAKTDKTRNEVQKAHANKAQVRDPAPLPGARFASTKQMGAWARGFSPPPRPAMTCGQPRVDAVEALPPPPPPLPLAHAPNPHPAHLCATRLTCLCIAVASS